MIERSIDYIQLTMDISEIQCIELKLDTIPPIRFYDRGYRDGNDFRIYFGKGKNSKALLIASGEPLQNMRERGYQDQQILNWALEHDAKFSRLDLAVTESMEESLTKIVTIKDVIQWLKQGLITSPLLGASSSKGIFSIQSEQDTAETLYIGDMQKRGKRGIFRAYDKGIELSLPPELKTRLELELKREKAHVNAKRIAETGDIAGNFRASFDVRHEEFERLMQAPAVVPVRGKQQKNREAREEQNKRWDWLINQVAPALRSAIAEDEKLGIGDARLTQFLIASGLTEEMIKASNIVAENKYKDKLYRNGLIDNV